MNKIFTAILILAPFFVFSQVLKEKQIPFYLNSDNDTLINVIDADDDNDGALDNADKYPINPNYTGNITQNLIISANADAGLRNNTTGTANTNYGSAATVQTKADSRWLIVKFTIPANLSVNTATLTFFSNTENDPLNVYFLPYNIWSESTITYNNTNFTNQQLLGTTIAPTAGIYSFNVPLANLPANGGEHTLLIYDPTDANIEELYTKETSGKTPTITLNYNVIPAPRLVIDQSYGTSTYQNGANMKVGFKLTQAPTSTVWLPIEISDTLKAKIVGNQVLVFDSSNWNVSQTIDIHPEKVGLFDVNIKPLHSDDSFYNGTNPDDLIGYTINATNIPNWGDFTIATGSTLNVILNAESSVGSTKFDFRIIEGPLGLNVVEYSGRLCFSPTSNQIGTFPVRIEITDEKGNVTILVSTITVTDGGVANPTGIYVVPFAIADPAEDGTILHPFNEISEATNAAVAAGLGNVFIRGGEYQQTTITSIVAAATFTNRVVIKPLTGEHVKINFKGNIAFEFIAPSRNIELQGIEIDGGTDEIDFWRIAGRAIWGDATVPRGGGICILLDSDSITIRNNYIHDAYQKAVEIRGARYVDIYGNIIQHIATTSLSGGHGIMRQQTGREFFDNDNLADYRWDIYGNMIFNVRQQIYSWVPSKGYMEMTLDEGKPILVDDPLDSNGIQEDMSARIKNNVLAFGALDHIRLKSTPNLEVSQNTIFADATTADGITDKKGDGNTPARFTNFKFFNNAVQVLPTRIGIDVRVSIAQSNATGNTASIAGNISANGITKPDSVPVITRMLNTQLFIDANGGNFGLNPSLGLPTTLGASPAILDALDERSVQFGVKIKWDGWVNDDVKLTQTILDNIPNVYDNINANETVFTNSGTISADTLGIHFNVVDGAWKATTNSQNTQDFYMNDNYVHWYKATLKAYKNENNQAYSRVRWGSSYVQQKFIFPNNWAMLSQITQDTNTVMLGIGQDFTLDGDLIVKFNGITPVVGDYFDLIIAENITTANTGKLFDYVQFDGYTPPNYSLAIVDVPNGKAVRLSILDVGCTSIVTNTNDAGAGSLRDALSCVADGGTVTLSASLEGQTIVLASTPLLITKNVSIVSEKKMIFVQNDISSGIEIATGKTAVLNNFQIVSNNLINNGNLTCTDMTFKAKDALSKFVFQNGTGSVLLLNNVLKIE